MLASLFAVLAPVFIVAGIGFAWARRGNAYPTDFIASLVMTIGTPSLVLSTLHRTRLDPGAFASMALACVICMVVMAGIGYLVSRAFGQHWRVLMPAFMYPNTGNMGLPVALYAFGDQGLALAVAFFLTLSSFQFTLGIAISGGAATLRSLLKNPIVISLALALPLIFFDLKLPLWLGNTVDLLGGMTIPLMLLTLGVSLASIRLSDVASGMLIGGLRIVLGAGVGWGIGMLLGLDTLERAILVMQSAMPVAVFNYLLAVRANRSPEQVANVVMCSTVLSFVWLPVVLAGWM
ncbi:AEC family transporter [Pseudomonas sp. GD04058]|uniref:AEC family transporter n=1 Tax=Pseudomonas sp. GD04058 TaxID=2975429 RepID=UPI0002A2BD7C|nr:AEC family transporter [Pseudomonas sp. GD04058]MDG9883745.1 AEC family transporter [Pseudomonas sp. GD04058]